MSYAGDLTPEETLDLLEERPDAVLVDVRTQAEWSYVGVPDLAAAGREAKLVEWNRTDGSRNTGFVADLAAAGITPGVPIAFLCRSGVRSKAAADAATEAGLGPAYNILDGFEGPVDVEGHRGGTAGWKASGLPWKQS